MVESNPRRRKAPEADTGVTITKVAIVRLTPAFHVRRTSIQPARRRLFRSFQRMTGTAACEDHECSGVFRIGRPKESCGYFSCSDSMWLTMLEIRSLFSVSLRSRPLKIGPHTGISLDPCAGASRSPSPVTKDSMRALGNAPPLRCAMVVRSGGGVFRAATTGPRPFPSRP